MATIERDDDILLTPVPSDDLKLSFPYMARIIWISKVLHMWPYTGEKCFFVYHLIAWIIIIYSLSFCASFAIQVGLEFQNMDSVSNLIDFVTVFISATFRFVYIYVRGDKYLLLISQFQKTFIDSSFFQTENRTFLMKYYKEANKLILAYCAFTIFWIAQFVSMPMILYISDIIKLSSNLNQTQVEPIPYPVAMKVYAPFDYYQQPANTLFYLYQFFGFFMFGFFYLVVDSFWIMIIYLTLGQFLLIKESLNSISEALEKNDETENGQLLNQNQVEEVSEGLKLCIKQHQLTRQFVHLVDDIINPNVLIDSLHAVISIGFILLDVTIALGVGDWHKIMYSCEYFMTSIIHMYCFDWLGNELADKEEELAEGIYELQWYRCPTQKPKFQMIMIQSRRPYRLTGGRMYKLSLEFFTSMTRAIFSYFTFLLQLKNGRTK